MTFFHFVNCAALAFAPYFIAYKYSVLSEFCSLWQCFQGALIFFITQFVKLLTYATFFPAHEAADVSWVQHFVTNVADLYDIVGLWLAINWITGRGGLRFLIAGFSWAVAHSLSTHLLPLIIGARKTAFQWIYIQRSLESNLDLVFFVALATLVWLSRRYDLNSYSSAHFILLIGLCRNPLFAILEHVWLIESWSLLSCKAAFSLSFGLLTVSTYARVNGVNSVHSKTA